MSETDPNAARKRRNMIIAWSLTAFVVLVFVITIVQLDRGG